VALQDQSLTDFDLFQSGHVGWQSIAISVAQINMHYARTYVTKPLVQGEIGYEKLGETHLEDFQRTAFWLSMLNGAAGHTYGANGVWEAYTADKPLHRFRWSFLSWREGMNLPGSYQVGLDARFLRQFAWWRFEPHPEWITPRGTTLLQPRADTAGFDLGYWEIYNEGLSLRDDSWFEQYPAGEWKSHNGNFRLPYSAGIPGEVRIVYMPNFGTWRRTPPTILGLEPGVKYHAFLWEPSLGTLVDLGAVERPPPGELIFNDQLITSDSSNWMDERLVGTVTTEASKTPSLEVASIRRNFNETNIVASVAMRHDSFAALLLRYHDRANYVMAVYSPQKKSVYLSEHKNGADNGAMGSVPVPSLSGSIRLSAELRDEKGAASVSDGQHTYTTAIVDVSNINAGSVGVLSDSDVGIDNFEARKSPPLIADKYLERKLYDAQGEYRGDLVGPSLGTTISGWDNFGKNKHLLLDAYLPETLPTAGDWILVLDATNTLRTTQHLAICK
jgi:hypothetical protein